MAAATHMSDAGAAWPSAADGVLRGLAHELSNRTGTIDAVAETLAAERPDSRLAVALTAEAERLRELLRLLRLLPADADRPAEPARPADVVADALALFALHPGGHGATADAAMLEDAPPVRVRVPALTRALLVLLAAAAGPEGRPVRVRATSDDAWLVLRVEGDGVLDDALAQAAGEAGTMVAADGGAAAREDRAVELRLPTLAALRRSEAGRGSDRR
jgi:hypothetical protein